MTFLEVASMVVTWSIVAFLRICHIYIHLYPSANSTCHHLLSTEKVMCKWTYSNIHNLSRLMKACNDYQERWLQTDYN